MTVAVVEAVSTSENCDPLALPPLHDAVAADALDALFEPGREPSGDRSCRVSFSYSDSYVSIENSERIVVETDTETPAPN